jgi:hypothetical protein
MYNRRDVMGLAWKGLAAAAVRGSAWPVTAAVEASALPQGLQQALDRAKAGLKGTRDEFQKAFAGADTWGARPAGAAAGPRAVWDERTGVLVKTGVTMPNAGVAIVEAELGRYASASGWQPQERFWLAFERRRAGARETWVPVAVRAIPDAMQTSVQLR